MARDIKALKRIKDFKFTLEGDLSGETSGITRGPIYMVDMVASLVWEGDLWKCQLNICYEIGRNAPLTLKKEQRLTLYTQGYFQRGGTGSHEDNEEQQRKRRGGF